MSYYFDQDGNPISLEEWARRFEDFKGRTLVENVTDAGTLITMWLGMVNGLIDGARLFGTAWVSAPDDGGRHVPVELELYDTKQEALAGHARHLQQLTERGRGHVRPDTPQAANAERQLGSSPGVET